ncbi:MAG: hypothetical protein AAF394_17185, partial [Planctomycetota bacterium]
MTLVLIVGAAPAVIFAQSLVPVALDFSADGNLLFVANRDSGSVSVLSSQSREPICEFEVRGQPIDLMVVGEQILVLDRKYSKLRVLGERGEQLAEHELLAPPARMTANADGDQVFVASTFGRFLQSFTRIGERWGKCSSCKLPIPPLEMKSGVALRRDDQDITVDAREVVVSCGAFHSPAMLMRS